MPVPVVYPDEYQFSIGPVACLREGSDVTVMANGTLVSRALEAVALLAERDGVNARMLSIPTVKPLDEQAIVAAAAETAGIVTVEEHTVHGGLGSAVAEVVVRHHPAPMRMLGIPGVFAPTGSGMWLFDHFGLTAEGIRAAALDILTPGSAM